MGEVRCVCMAEFCDHGPGERCGKEVTVKLKTKVALDGMQFSPEVETGICEDCWNSTRDNIPWLFLK
jgi:hypothetical protein